MPLSFTITREDMLRSKTIDPGWYKVRVNKISQEPAGTDGSTNSIVDFVVVEGPAKDVPLRRYFSEKAPGFIVPFIVACQNGKPIGEQGGTFDLEMSKGKEILVYVKNEEYQNRLTNKVEDFRPIGAAAAK